MLLALEIFGIAIIFTAILVWIIINAERRREIKKRLLRIISCVSHRGREAR